MEEEDPYVLPAWAVESSHAHDYLDSVFPSGEAIIEAMSGVEPPWEELHHRSYFLPELDLWSVKTLGRFLVRELVVLWFH